MIEKSSAGCEERLAFSWDVELCKVGRVLGDRGEGRLERYSGSSVCDNPAHDSCSRGDTTREGINRYKREDSHIACVLPTSGVVHETSARS